MQICIKISNDAIKTIKYGIIKYSNIWNNILNKY